MSVRFAGPDRYWDGSAATLISGFAHPPPAYKEALRTLGEGPMIDLVHELERGGQVERLANSLR